MSDECYIDAMPIEIFINILSHLTGKEVVRCRAVSSRWREIIDEITEHEYFWKTKCIKDFPNVLNSARKKCREGMLWYDLYRSLSLWPKLGEAIEDLDEFCPASIVSDEIQTFTILPNGIIGVHKRDYIAYYDIETFQPADLPPVPGSFTRYAENEHVLITQSINLDMYIKRKRFDRPLSVVNSYENVRSFILLDHCVYYIDTEEKLNIVNFSDVELKSQFICKCTEGIMAMGYKKDQLQLLSYERKVFKLEGKNLVFAEFLGPQCNLLHQLLQRNLLELLDWRIYVQWSFGLNHNMSRGALPDTVTTRTYGNVVLVGSNWGVLRIYYQPFTLGELDLENAHPLKQYNFMERLDCPVLSMCSILAIDVFELVNGHLIIVGMPKKIAVLSYKHNYLQSRNGVLNLPDLPEPQNSSEQAEGIQIIPME